MAQRVQLDIVERDTALVTAVLNGFDTTTEANQRVEDIMHQISESKNVLINDLQQRIWFHLFWGLQKVEVTIDNDFSRLWEVLDERTLRHVTTGFYQTSALFRDMVQKSLENINLEERSFWYGSTKRDLLMRANLVERALDNLTVIHEAYTKGIPDFVFRKSPKRHYDRKWIPYELFENLEGEEKKYNKWVGYLHVIRDQVMKMLRINSEVYFNLTANLDEVNEVLGVFEHRCRSHNYYKYTYYYKYIQKAKTMTVNKLQAFQDLADELKKAEQSLELSISTVFRILQRFKKGPGKELSAAIGNAIRYLEDNQLTKVKVAAILNSEELWPALNSINVLFKDLRAKALAISEQWHQMGRIVLRVWSEIMSEPWTSRFYQTVHDELDMYNATGSTNLLSIWEEILERYETSEIAWPNITIMLKIC